jgi:CheY-like chemotaxis protein
MSPFLGIDVYFQMEIGFAVDEFGFNQMPVMDSFEASRHIKAMIAKGEIGTVPIVALTANAMKGDRERCLDAGMDDYETKPVRKKGLIDILTRWCVAKENLAAQQISMALPESAEPPPAPESSPAAVKSKTAAANTSILDQACLNDLREVMGDQFKIIIEYYLDDAANYLEQIKKGWHTNDDRSIVAAAHPLKSSSCELGVIELSDIAKRVEENARQANGDNGKISSIGSLVDQLNSCFDKARSELQTILRDAA